MPARVIQRIGDEPGVSREAYSHNQAHHDGAGIDAQLSDLFGPATTGAELAQYRRMYRTGIFTALGCYLAAMIVVEWGGDDWFLHALVGVQILAGMANSFMAGKWARRIESVTVDLARLLGDAGGAGAVDG